MEISISIFLRKVNNVLEKQLPWKYDELMQLLDAFQRGDIAGEEAAAKVNVLFAGNLEVILAFAGFLQTGGSLHPPADLFTEILGFTMQVKHRFIAGNVYLSIARSLSEYSDGKKSLRCTRKKIEKLIQEHPDLVHQFQELIVSPSSASPTDCSSAPPPSSSISAKKRPAPAAAEAAAIEIPPNKKQKRSKRTSVKSPSLPPLSPPSPPPPQILRDIEGRERRPDEWGPSYRAVAGFGSLPPLAGSPLLNKELESKDPLYGLCPDNEIPKKLTASEEKYFEMEEELYESDMMMASLEAMIDLLDPDHESDYHRVHVRSNTIARHFKRIYGSASQGSKKMEELIEHIDDDHHISFLLSQLKEKKENLMNKREVKRKQEEKRMMMEKKMKKKRSRRMRNN